MQERAAMATATPGAEGAAELAATASEGMTERQVQEKLREAGKRLKTLVDVNRKLHKSLSEKKARAAELRKANEEMEPKLEAREMEEAGRHRQLHELHVRQQHPPQQQQLHELQKAVLALEEKIEAVNEENLALGQRHKDIKESIADKKNSMKMLQRRGKELARHLEFMAGHLNEAQLMLGMARPSSGSGGYGRGGKPRQRTAPIIDFRRLPGLDLEKLLGEDASIANVTLARAATTASPSLSRDRSPSPAQKSSRAAATVAAAAAGGGGGDSEAAAGQELGAATAAATAVSSENNSFGMADGSAYEGQP